MVLTDRNGEKMTYSFDIFHSIRFYLRQVLIAKVYIPLCEDITAAIVVSISSEFIREVLRIRQYFRAILKY